jgi:hypothetical protein
MSGYLEITSNKKKTKHTEQSLLLLLLLGGGYYFFFHLPNKRKKAKEEIRTMLENSNFNLDDLNANLWKGANNWEKYLDNCYLSSQINLFMKEMKNTIKEQTIKNQGKSIEELRKEVITNIENFAEKEIKFNPLLEKDLKKLYKRIKQASNDDISIIEQEAISFITEQKHKRQGLHWLRNSHNWADKKIVELEQDFTNAWNQHCSIVNPNNEVDKEPKRCNFGASYKIKFPPSLWNELSEEQKSNKKAEELKLREEVENYTFNPKIDNWYDKVLVDPVRGERDKSNIDNNATLYGAPRTGKSIIVEKLTCNADRYPLVVIQGSALTPNINDQKCGIDNFKKFIYTICDINNTLVDEFGLERNPESGEPQYIFFIDEANQVSENTFARKSSGLIFLKECTGSDDYKNNESHNLWIIATNYLSEIDEAVYQPGRLANQLNFSWTLGKFKEYSEDAGIYYDFPQHWQNTNSLSKEDNKWVNRFNIIHFEESFLGRKIGGDKIENGVQFWEKFINNPDNKEILEEIKEEAIDKDNKVITDEKTGKPKEIIKQKGIPLGEFLEFFWQKFDSGELWDRRFDFKFTNPREPKIEKAVVEIGTNIQQTLDIRLKEIEKTSDNVLNEMKASNNVFHENFNKSVEHLGNLLSEIGKKIR